ncbi:MAG: hypothetical protein ABI656_00005, partial [bacterium]
NRCGCYANGICASESRREGAECWQGQVPNLPFRRPNARALLEKAHTRKWLTLNIGDNFGSPY